MRKNRKIIILIMLLMISLLTSCKKNVNIVESFPEKITNLNSYKIVGKLETMFPTGTKECEVTAYYQKPDLFRVEIKNPNVEELQVIIKNAEGVFVIVPSINKTFKVICDGYDVSNNIYIGRSYMSSPDVDFYIYFHSTETINQGDIVDVKIIDFKRDYLLGVKQ